MRHLKDIVAECKVISLPRSDMRQAQITVALEVERIPFSFSPGVQAPAHAMGCTCAHLQAVGSITSLPTLVLEDDVTPNTSPLILPPIPTDADIIYLGVSPFGCLPPSGANISQFGHTTLYNLALATQENVHWLRLHSMSGAIAILYVSQRGVDAWIQAMDQSLKHRKPFDVFTTYAMPSLNVYAPNTPLFYENPQVQAPLKHVTPEQRLSWTKTPFTPNQKGRLCIHSTMAPIFRHRLLPQKMGGWNGL